MKDDHENARMQQEGAQRTMHEQIKEDVEAIAQQVHASAVCDACVEMSQRTCMPVCWNVMKLLHGFCCPMQTHCERI